MWLLEISRAYNNKWNSIREQRNGSGWNKYENNVIKVPWFNNNNNNNDDDDDDHNVDVKRGNSTRRNKQTVIYYEQAINHSRNYYSLK